MAKAIVEYESPKPTPIKLITLELSPEEARFIRTVLGQRCYEPPGTPQHNIFDQLDKIRGL